MRWPVIIAGIAVWNALVALDWARSSGGPPQPGPFTLFALLLAFLLSLGTLMFPELQSVILKPDRSFGEIRPFVRLLAFVSGLMWFFLLFVFASGGFNRTP